VKCPHQSAADIRSKAIDLLTTTLKSCNTDPVISTILVGGCRHWLETGSTTFDTEPPAHHPAFAVLKVAIQH
jgi:hypothetical protein